MPILETEEQLEIRMSVRKAATQEIPAYQTEAHYGTVPLELFKKFAALGLAGLSIEESFGGIAASRTTALIVMEELATVDLGPAVFISVHSMVSGLIQSFGNTEQKKQFLPHMSSGDILGAFALTEPSAGSDAANLQTSYRVDGDSYILNGEKCYITSAGWAGLYVVFARSAKSAGKQGVSAFIVECDRPGLIINKPEKKMGAELSPIASLRFENMKLPKTNLLGNIDEGYKIALSGLAGGRVNIASCANGVARAALDRALAHLKERTQFGQKLVEFQGLQFMLADMKMKLEAARLLTWQAGACVDKDSKSNDARLYPAMAKCFATDSAMAITTDAVQLLGGAGYIKEYEVERYMRDAKVLQIVEGTNQIQRMIIAREIANLGA